MIYPYSNKQTVLDTDKAKGYKLTEVNQRELVQLELEAGGMISAHSLPIHVTFYVVSGSGKIIIDSKSYSASEGDVLDVKSNLQRSWVNDGDELLSLLVIKEVNRTTN